MKHLFIQLNVAVVLLLAFSFHCFGAKEYTLEYNLEKGKTYKQRMLSETNVTMNAMGQDVTMSIEVQMDINYNVIERNGDVFDLQMSYQKMKMNMSAPALFSIDSDLPDSSSDKNISNVIQSMMGIPIDVQLTKQGKVVSVKGLDKLEAKLDSIDNEQFKDMFSQQFSEKMIRQALEQSSIYMSAKPVAIDDSWDVTSTVSSNGIDIINKMNLTLKEVKDDVATLEIIGTLATPEGGAFTTVQGVDAEVSMNGDQTGTIQMDLKTGWIISSEINQNSEQNINVMGQTIQQDVEVKAIITAE